MADGDVLEVEEVRARLPCAVPRACAACVFSPMYVSTAYILPALPTIQYITTYFSL